MRNELQDNLENRISTFGEYIEFRIRNNLEPLRALVRVRDVLEGNSIDTDLITEKNKNINQWLEYCITLLGQPEDIIDFTELSEYLVKLEALILSPDLSPLQHQIFADFKILLETLSAEAKLPENLAILEGSVFRTFLTNQSLWANLSDSVLIPFNNRLRMLNTRLNFQTLEGGSAEDQKINTDLLKQLERILESYLK